VHWRNAESGDWWGTTKGAGVCYTKLCQQQGMVARREGEEMQPSVQYNSLAHITPTLDFTASSGLPKQHLGF